MRCLVPVLGAIVCQLLGPLAADAQTAPRAPVSRGDLTVSTGSYNASLDSPTPYDYDRWTNTIVGVLTGGFYWTDHIKTEIEGSWTPADETTRTLVHPLGQPGAYLYEHQRTSVTKISPAQLWQFGRNAWVHSFAGAGVDIERRRTVVDRPPQIAHIPSPGGAPGRLVPVEAVRTDETTYRTVPFVVAGVKAYFGERSFARTDLKLNVRDGVDEVTWRIGIGVDF
jgi:hypothetical protein